MANSLIFDGTKATNINSFPPEAWTISGTQAENPEYESAFLSVVYRSIKLRSNAVSAMPFVISERTSGDIIFSSVEDAMFDRLPIVNNLSEHFYMAEASLCIDSQAFFHKNRNRAGVVQALQYMQPDSVKPKWDKDDGLIGFIRTVGRHKHTYSLEDMLYVCFQNPFKETEAEISPLDSAAKSAGVIIDVDSFVSEFMRRGAVKATLLQVAENTSELERKRLKSWWDKAMDGVRSAWTAHVIGNEIKPIIIGEGLEALKDTGITQQRKEDITTSFGIPYSKLFGNAANFATAQQDDLSFYKETIIPEALRIEQAFNDDLFYELGLSLRFTPQTLPIFQEDETNRAQAFKHLVDSMIKPSIVAQILGYTLPEGIEFSDLDMPEESIITVIDEPPPPQLVDTQAMDEEKARFKRWLSKRNNPQIDRFESDILTESDKAKILGAVTAETVDSFPDWNNYP
jgi:HK97 family phage portal protein